MGNRCWRPGSQACPSSPQFVGLSDSYCLSIKSSERKMGLLLISGIIRGIIQFQNFRERKGGKEGRRKEEKENCSADVNLRRSRIMKVQSHNTQAITKYPSVHVASSFRCTAVPVRAGFVSCQPGPKGALSPRTPSPAVKNCIVSPRSFCFNYTPTF